MKMWLLVSKLQEIQEESEEDFDITVNFVNKKITIQYNDRKGNNK